MTSAAPDFLKGICSTLTNLRHKTFSAQNLQKVKTFVKVFRTQDLYGTLKCNSHLIWQE